VSAARVISPAQTTGDSGDRIIRYTLADRVNHWIAGLSYIYCLLTGLAFWSPYMFWLATLVGG
jgi:formate dehydrogenase subunit gamma